MCETRERLRSFAGFKLGGIEALRMTTVFVIIMDMNKPKTAEIRFAYILGKATEVSFNLVFFPIILLFFGLFIDKRLNTTPLFIIIGCLSGLFFALYKATKVKDLIYGRNDEIKKGRKEEKKI